METYDKSVLQAMTASMLCPSSRRYSSQKEAKRLTQATRVPKETHLIACVVFELFVFNANTKVLRPNTHILPHCYKWMRERKRSLTIARRLRVPESTRKETCNLRITESNLKFQPNSIRSSPMKPSPRKWRSMGTLNDFAMLFREFGRRTASIIHQVHHLEIYDYIFANGKYISYHRTVERILNSQ